MKVILVNGSPNEKKCTYTALSEVAKTLEENGVETEIFQLGNKPMADCIGCGACKKTGQCFRGDKVNEFVEKAKDADGFVFGSPVYYAASSGALSSFLNRVFVSGGKNLSFKPGAAVCSARRAGTTSTLDEINKYFTISNMPIVSSQYWNMVHGSNVEDVKNDLEGMQTMRILGRNMAWLLKCIEFGRENNINKPELEERIWTNFIRN